MIVNVCPAATTAAPPERVWSVLTTPRRFGEWLGASFVSSEPAGPVGPGQVIYLAAPSVGRKWAVRMDVRGMDPQHRWLDLVVHLDLTPAALDRRTEPAQRWTLPAYRRYAGEVMPTLTADIVVRVDDPAHPAVVVDLTDQA